MSIRYNSIKPSNQQSSYQPFDNIDFEVDFPNRKIVGNSFRIVGTAKVLNNASAVAPTTDEFYVDNLVGAHSFFSEMVVSTSKSGNLQNLQNYPSISHSTCRVRGKIFNN